MTGQLSESMQIACKYCQAERQYKMLCTRQLRQNLLLHFAEQTRLWLINYYSSQLRFAHQRAVPVWPLLCSVQVSMTFSKSDESVCPQSVVDLKDSGDELMPTKCPHSSHPSNLQDRTGHQPGFSRPPSMVERRAECRYRS